MATAVNDYSKSHTLMKHFSQKAGESSDKIWLHAEVAALLKCKDKEVHSILVQRYDAFGNPKLARPCKTCQEAIKAFGVKEVRYTTEEGVKSYATE